MTKDEIKAIRDLADAIVRADGDRDHMNQSNLRVEQTLLCAEALRACTDSRCVKCGAPIFADEPVEGQPCLDCIFES